MQGHGPTARFFRLTPVLALLVVVGCALGVARASAASVCGPAHGKTIVGSDKGRVYTVKEKGGRGAVRTLACVRGGKPKALLAPAAERRAETGERIANPVLRAPWVAFSWEVIQIDVQRAGVTVVNARTGRTLRISTALTVDSPWVSVSELVLRKTGSIAWIAEGGDGAEGLLAREVSASDRSGTRVLDDQPGIAPHSLRLIGSTVSWEVDGLARTAPLD